MILHYCGQVGSARTSTRTNIYGDGGHATDGERIRYFLCHLSAVLEFEIVNIINEKQGQPRQRSIM